MQVSCLVEYLGEPHQVTIRKSYCSHHWEMHYSQLQIWFDPETFLTKVSQWFTVASDGLKNILKYT